ncbi:MAG: hypothetical protein IKD95_05605 [Bacteroidales bacterium]|nr:hypothetical protein [Bacteroidales bacterium]
MDNEWKNSLRERFSDYASPEPEGLWEGIEQGMAGKPRRKMLPVWIASGLAAAAAVALGVFLHPEKTLEAPDLQKQATLAQSVAEPVVVDTAATSFPSVTTTSSPSVTTTSSPALTGDLEAASGSKSVPFAVASRQTLLAEAEPAASVPVPEETVPDAVDDRHSRLDRESVVEQEISVAEKKEVSVMPDLVGHDDQVERDDRGALTAQVPASEIIPASKRKRFSIGAYGNGGQASSEQMQGYGMNRTGEYLGTRATGSNVKNDVGGLMRTLASNRASSFEAHHSAPLRVGVTAAWELTPHLNLVSGLNWTYLNSEFEETANPIRTVVGQDLGYLGVPLRLETAFNVWKGLWLSAGAGGMVEKGLLSSSWTNTWIDGQMAETVKNSKPDTGGLLWSVGATAGAEYRFSPSFGLYFTPGVEYHFDNGAEVRSAYTEKPLHWNVNLGVRFHFGN